MLRFYEGEWVQRKSDGLIGYVEEPGAMWSIVYFPTTAQKFNLLNHNMHKIGGSPSAEDILTLMDIALIPMDEEWLRELCTKYDQQWRREIGITS